MTIPLGIFNPAQAAFLLGIAAVLGACLGSFVNCLAWRLANGESVLAGRSHCTSCGHVLGALDLVPVASWLALRGRCRHCGQRVSPRYVIVEALMAALFAAIVVRYGLSVQTAAYLVLVCILMAVALVDLDTFIIPSGFVVAGCVLWLVSIWFMPAPRVDAFLSLIHILCLAMSDPLYFMAIEAVKNATRKRVIPMVTTHDSLMRAIMTLYGNEGAARAIEEMKRDARTTGADAVSYTHLWTSCRAACSV